MATSEPLVPKGLPQGSRQQIRSGMRQAGLPLAPPPSGAPTTAAPALSVLDAGPDAFPFLADLAAQGDPAAVESPEAPRSIHQALAASAQSDFARAVIARLNQRSG